jgi:hypothetical protein
MVRFDPDTLENVDKEIRQGIVSVAVEGEMLTVPETAACKEDRQVGRHRDVGIAQFVDIYVHQDEAYPPRPL